MPALALAERHVKGKDAGKNLFRDLRLAACLHVSKETAVLIEALHSTGLEIELVAANPLSSQDHIASYLKSIGISVSARSGETFDEYEGHIQRAAKSNPDLIIDDGGELHVAYHATNSSGCRGGTDETTTGAIRLRALDAVGRLRYPVISVNEAKTKHIFDNKYGSGQSAIDGVLRATGLLLAGKCVVVTGYGWVGRGVAERARGMGAHVTVTEVDGLKAVEAHLDGFEVLPMIEAASKGDMFLTCTGQIKVIRNEHFGVMQDGAILANMGHFDKEIDVPALYKRAKKVESVRPGVQKIEFSDGKSIFLLCEGRVVNLVAAEGHPPEVMQLSFANQLLSLYYLVENNVSLTKNEQKVLKFPEEIDSLVTAFALKSFNLRIDELTQSQVDYANSYTSE